MKTEENIMKAKTELEPGWVEAVNRASEESVDYVIMTLGAFAESEAEKLYQALQYASESGVAVMIAPLKSGANNEK